MYPTVYMDGTADCISLATSKLNSGKTTIDFLCLNRGEGNAEVGKIIRFICGSPE